MALTDEERSRIRQLLGWPERFHQTDSALEQSMNAIDTRVESLPLLRASLVETATIDGNIRDAKLRFQAEQVGSIKLQGVDELGLLRSLGRAEVGKIAVQLGVEVRHDYYSGTLPRSRATARGPRGGGNMAPRG